MEEPILYTLLFSLLTIILFFTTLKIKSLKQKPYKNLPPTPPYSLPILGHLHLLKTPLHRTLHRLSLPHRRHGLLALRFGSRRVIVVSSASAAEECFTKNDVALAARPRFLLAKHLGYNHTIISAASYGAHWRNLRRIAAVQIFSSARLRSFSASRRDEIVRCLKILSQNSKIDLKPIFSQLTYNLTMRMVAGKRYFGDEVKDEDEAAAARFREIVREIMSYAGASNPRDFLPILNWIGKVVRVDGLEKRLKRLAEKTDGFLQGLVDEHRKRGESQDTMIDHLLSLRVSEPEYYTDEIIKGLILVSLFFNNMIFFFFNFGKS